MHKRLENQADLELDLINATSSSNIALLVSSSNAIEFFVACERCHPFHPPVSLFKEQKDRKVTKCLETIVHVLMVVKFSTQEIREKKGNITHPSHATKTHQNQCLPLGAGHLMGLS